MSAEHELKLEIEARKVATRAMNYYHHLWEEQGTRAGKAEARAEAAEARVKELEDALRLVCRNEASDEIK